MITQLKDDITTLQDVIDSLANITRQLFVETSSNDEIDDMDGMTCCLMSLSFFTILI